MSLGKCIYIIIIIINKYDYYTFFQKSEQNDTNL